MHYHDRKPFLLIDYFYFASNQRIKGSSTMQVITDLGDLARVRFPGLRGMLTQRLNQIELRDGEALADVGAFFVAEGGDGVAAVEAATGCPIVTSHCDASRFGDDEFSPSFEWLEHHADAGCFELCFVTSDDFFVALFVPDAPGIDPELLRFCRHFS
jgi:hypothetical protein